MPIFGSVPMVPSAGHHRSASLADDIEFERHSLPFSRLAGRMLASGGPLGRSGGEGPVLGPLGGILDGDNR